MFQGFYGLSSSMLTQTRNLNVISNNMANVSTPGYKNDTFIEKTFGEEMAYRSQNKAMAGATQIGAISKAVVADRNYTNFAQSAVSPTGRSLDFALQSSGFFTIQGANGNVYTRNGSFSLDNEGYLTLQGQGRVMGVDGPILLGTDKINVDASGNIYSDETGEYLNRIAVVDFENYDAQLTKAAGGVFTANGAATAVDARVMNQATETSNVDAMKEMVDMMASQRTLQSSSQVLQMYDTLMGKIVTQLGPR